MTPPPPPLHPPLLHPHPYLYTNAFTASYSSSLVMPFTLLYTYSKFCYKNKQNKREYQLSKKVTLYPNSFDFNMYACHINKHWIIKTVLFYALVVSQMKLSSSIKMGRNGRKRKCVVGKRRSLFFWIASEPIQTTKDNPIVLLFIIKIETNIT